MNNIEVSKLSIYREEDIKYITPIMIIFSVLFIINHFKIVVFCVKQTSLRDVSFTHQNIFLLSVIKKVHFKALFLIPAYLKFISNITSISTNQISYFRGFAVYSEI